MCILPKKELNWVHVEGVNVSSAKGVDCWLCMQIVGSSRSVRSAAGFEASYFEPISNDVPGSFLTMVVLVDVTIDALDVKRPVQYSVEEIKDHHQTRQW